MITHTLTLWGIAPDGGDVVRMAANANETRLRAEMARREGAGWSRCEIRPCAACLAAESRSAMAS